jgi:hypothetical protein
MNIIIYTVITLVILYFLLKIFSNLPSRKISNNLRYILIIGLVLMAILMAIAGRYILTLPLTFLSMALLKLKGLSVFQIISLFRLIQTLRSSGRFSFNQNHKFTNSNNISLSEAYKILNLDINKKITKEEVNKAYIKIQKKIHPDVSPETARLSSIVNEAKDLILKNIA